MENNRSRIQAWLEAARPKTLPASFSPVLVGCALAYRDGVSGTKGEKECRSPESSGLPEKEHPLN